MARTSGTKLFGQTFYLVLVLYVWVAGLIFVPYYNWQYAKENGFVKWLVLGEIVPTCKAAVWPYFVFFSKGDSQRASLRHLARSIEYKNESTRLVNEGGLTVKDKDMQKIVDLRRKALEESKLVDAEVLDRKYDGFSSHFTGEYVKGLQLFIAGYDEDDSSKFLEGQILLDKWGDWYESNMLERNGRGSAGDDNADRDALTTAEQPPFNADEMDRYSRILSKIDRQAFTDADLAQVRQVMEDYTKRTGSRMTRAQYDMFLGLMKLNDDYMYELGQSLLISWDRKERFTTSGYDRLSQRVAELGVRRADKLAIDKATLEAASENQPYVEDDQGRAFEFGREVILDRMKENELARANMARLAKLMDDFVE